MNVNVNIGVKRHRKCSMLSRPPRVRQSKPSRRATARRERVRKSSPEQIFAAMLDSARAQVHDIQEQMAATHARALEEAKAAAREVAS